MVIVEHRGHAVKAEAVKAVFLKPVFAVGKQEVEHFSFAIVKAERVPCRMLAASVAVEVQVRASVEASESLHFILYSVGVYYIHYHRYAQFMSFVNEALEILRCAEAA